MSVKKSAMIFFLLFKTFVHFLSERMRTHSLLLRTRELLTERVMQTLVNCSINVDDDRYYLCFLFYLLDVLECETSLDVHVELIRVLVETLNTIEHVYFLI